VTRTEDPALLVGAGRYLADLPLEGALHAVFVRSDVAHGTIDAVHVDEATAMPGVVRVLTGDTLGVAPHHGFVKVHDDFARPPLATDRVRFVGEPYAVVLAETVGQGHDAAQSVWADITPLPTVVDPEAALEPGSEVLFPEHGSNQAQTIVDRHPFDDSIFGDADRIVRGRYVNQRIAVVPMEVDCAAAEVGSDGRLTLWASTQMPHALHGQLAAALELDPSQVRIVTPQVGGGFGGKAGIHAEYSVVAAAARLTGRPVVWVPPRSDDMKALPHSRGQVQYVELGVRRDGTFTGLRIRIVGDAGAYPTVGAYLPGGTRRMAPGNYRFDTVACDVAVAATNTTPMGAYRGAGRPEATALVERAVDQAALTLGIDPIEIRLRNFLADDAFPHTTPTGNTYDSGRYAVPLEHAAELIGYERLRDEQRRRRVNGGTALLGIGVAAYVEITAGGGSDELGAVEVHADGSATIIAGTLSHGQGHQTA
jgi:carbon-monoxide dehydrogenase large subunit